MWRGVTCSAAKSAIFHGVEPNIDLAAGHEPVARDAQRISPGPTSKPRLRHVSPPTNAPTPPNCAAARTPPAIRLMSKYLHLLECGQPSALPEYDAHRLGPGYAAGLKGIGENLPIIHDPIYDK